MKVYTMCLAIAALLVALTVTAVAAAGEAGEIAPAPGDRPITLTIELIENGKRRVFRTSKILYGGERRTLTQVINTDYEHTFTAKIEKGSGSVVAPAYREAYDDAMASSITVMLVPTLIGDGRLAVELEVESLEVESMVKIKSSDLEIRLPQVVTTRFSKTLILDTAEEIAIPLDFGPAADRTEPGEASQYTLKLFAKS